MLRFLVAMLELCRELHQKRRPSRVVSILWLGVLARVSRSDPIHPSTPPSITRYDFDGEFTFGTQAATNFVVHSAGFLSATVPPALVTGTVDVRVTTPYGTSVITSYDHYTYNGPLVTSLSPVSGATAGGKPLVINGKNFTGAKSVTVGSTVIKANAFVNQSATKITVKAPAHAAGTVQVLVTTATGTSPTYAVGGTPNLYSYEGTPTVTGLSPGAITHATKTSVVITGTGLLGATKVVVGSAVATITANPSTTSLTVTTSALAKGTYYVQVTTVSGTSAKVAAAKLTVN